VHGHFYHCKFCANETFPWYALTFHSHYCTPYALVIIPTTYTLTCSVHTAIVPRGDIPREQSETAPVTTLQHLSQPCHNACHNIVTSGQTLCISPVVRWPYMYTFRKHRYTGTKTSAWVAADLGWRAAATSFSPSRESLGKHEQCAQSACISSLIFFARVILYCITFDLDSPL